MNLLTKINCNQPKKKNNQNISYSWRRRTINDTLLLHYYTRKDNDKMTAVVIYFNIIICSDSIGKK